MIKGRSDHQVAAVFFVYFQSSSVIDKYKKRKLSFARIVHLASRLTEKVTEHSSADGSQIFASFTALPRTKQHLSQVAYLDGTALQPSLRWLDGYKERGRFADGFLN